jgi:hypothetical protein
MQGILKWTLHKKQMNNSYVIESTWLKIHLRLDKRVSMCWSMGGIIHWGDLVEYVWQESSHSFLFLSRAAILWSCISASEQRTTDTCKHDVSPHSSKLRRIPANNPSTHPVHNIFEYLAKFQFQILNLTSTNQHKFERVGYRTVHWFSEPTNYQLAPLFRLTYIFASVSSLIRITNDRGKS